MTDGQPRTREQRRAGALAKLAAPAADVWVATAGGHAGSIEDAQTHQTRQRRIAKLITTIRGGLGA